MLAVEAWHRERLLACQRLRVEHSTGHPGHEHRDSNRNLYAFTACPGGTRVRRAQPRGVRKLQLGHDLRRQLQGSYARALPQIEADPGLPRSAERRRPDAAGRSAGQRCGGHRVSRRLVGVLAVRAPARVHPCDIRAHPGRQRRPSGKCFGGAIKRPAAAPSWVCVGQSQPGEIDLEPARALLRQHPQPEIPRRSGRRPALTRRDARRSASGEATGR